LEGQLFWDMAACMVEENKAVCIVRLIISGAWVEFFFFFFLW